MPSDDRPPICDLTHLPGQPCPECKWSGGLSSKKLRFKLSPELGDGENWTVVDNTADVLEAVRNWCDVTPFGPDGGCEGAIVTIKTVLLTQEEVDALPEI